MIRNLNQAWNIVFWCTISSIYCRAERYTGVTIAKCSIQEKLFDSSYFALTRVDSIGRDLTQFSNKDPRIMCRIYDRKMAKHKSNVALELIVEDDPPAMISIQIADMFLNDLEFSTMICSYQDVGHANRVDPAEPKKVSPTPQSGTYVCDEIKELDIILTGIHWQSEARRMSKRSEVVTKTDAKKDTKCSKYIVEAGAMERFELQGMPCTRIGETFLIGRRWMFNPSGLSDCLPCCVNFHWDEDAQQCTKCPPGTTQPTSNVWRNCELVRKSTNVRGGNESDRELCELYESEARRLANETSLIGTQFLCMLVIIAVGIMCIIAIACLFGNFCVALSRNKGNSLMSLRHRRSAQLQKASGGDKA